MVLKVPSSLHNLGGGSKGVRHPRYLCKLGTAPRLANSLPDVKNYKEQRSLECASRGGSIAGLSRCTK